MFNLQPSIDDMLKRCCYILKNENVIVSEEQKPLLINLINNQYPDLRNIINSIQKFSITGKLLIDFNDSVKLLTDYIYNSLSKKIDLYTIRKKIIEEETKFNSDYQLLLKELFEFFYSSNIHDMKKKNILMDIGEYMYRDVTVLDKEINFFCCIISLYKIIND
jgi:hypothetical protein